MTDTIIKGSGNSRTLVTVPNAPTLYPTHEELMQKWATEGIPIDLLGPNASGVDVLGTLLNKANLLSDETAALLGLGADATVNDALKKMGHIETGIVDGNGKTIYVTASGQIKLAMCARDWNDKYSSYGLFRIDTELFYFSATRVTNLSYEFTVGVAGSTAISGNQYMLQTTPVGLKQKYFLLVSNE